MSHQPPRSVAGGPAEAALRLEARRFGAYLVGAEPPDESVGLYAQAVRTLGLAGTDKDGRLLRFMGRHRWSIGFVDAGLAVSRPDSVVRTRLLVLSAILEASPELADMFLPTPKPAIYAAYAALVGLRAALKAAIGLVLVRWI